MSTVSAASNNGLVSYHLSSNGTDESTCGSSEETACRTLEHVLSLYYNTTKIGLKINTSTPLTINQQLMVCDLIFI